MCLRGLQVCFYADNILFYVELLAPEQHVLYELYVKTIHLYDNLKKNQTLNQAAVYNHNLSNSGKSCRREVM